MNKFWLFLLSTLCYVNSHGSMPETKADGEAFGKLGNQEAQAQIGEISGEELRDPSEEPFDSERTLEQLLNHTTPQNRTHEFLSSPQVQQNIHYMHPDDYLLKRSDSVLIGQDAESIQIDTIEESSPYQTHTCLEAGAPYPLSLTRSLKLDVLYEAEGQEERWKCLGHEKKKTFWTNNGAKKWIEKQTNKLSHDNTVKTVDSEILDNGLLDKSIAIVSWIHNDEIKACDHGQQQVTQKPERWEVLQERWEYDDQALGEQASTIHAKYIGQQCLDSTPKVIHGRQVARPCWKERLSFLYTYPQSPLCDVLKKKNCLEAERKCVVEGTRGCALWEVTYRCFDQLRFKTVESPEALYGLGAEEWPLEDQPNQAFPDVSTKLTVFKQIQEELQHENNSDSTKVELFKGKEMSCAKNVADKILYDCCDAFGGLANELKLSQCTPDEISLGTLREKGLCHYVGKHEERFLDLWKSRTKHIFCCFPSKLARVFLEQARQQLGIGWGSPEKPNCHGLYMQELQQVDFGKLDLSEAYEQLAQDVEKRLEKKLLHLEEHLKDRMRSEQT